MRDSTQRLRALLASEWQLELDRGILMLLLPVPIGAGAAAYFLLPVEPDWWWIGLAGVTWLVLGWTGLRRRPDLAVVWTAAFLAMAGFAAAKWETDRAATRMLGSEVTTRITAQVAVVDHLANGRTRLTLDILSTERPRLRFAPARVRATARKVPDGIRAGQTVEGVVRLMPPSGPATPGGYDFSFESYFDGLGANGFFLVGPTLSERTAPLTWSHRIENTRDRIAQRIRSVIGGAEGAVAAALVVGVRASIPEPVNDALRKTGLAHVLSISGLHMALVAGCVMGAMRAGLALFPNLASRRAVKKAAAGTALFAISVYVLLSGADVAAQRSYLMLAIMLGAVLFDRAAISMRNVSLAAALLLLWSPHELMGPSFQMSFAATAALVAAYGWWSRRERRSRARDHSRSKLGSAMSWVFNAGAALAATSLIAGFATLVFGAYHFGRVAPYGLFANLAAMPFVSVFVMPFCVLGTLLMPLGLDGFCWRIVGWGLTAVLRIADFLAYHSPLDVIGLVSPWAMLAVGAAIILLSAGTTRWAFLALLPLAAALPMQGMATRPQILISEDAGLVGVATAAGDLAVNKPRGEQFLLRSWQAALAADTVLRPTAAGRDTGAFTCDADTCTVKAPDGSSIVHTQTAASARPHCKRASLIVIAKAGERNPCGASTTVLTARELARGGTAAIHLPKRGDAAAEVRFAVSEPFRPWHAQRQYSRAARGLPERPRAKKKPVSAPVGETPALAPNP
ncbi:MAG: competence protein [Mesorhizobium amorphae]|nr:MAG: competence protein [Mesorhizobium amorphae]